MQRSAIIQDVCRILYPFMLLFGMYIIVYGDQSPGGGFQGGVVLATAQLSRLFIVSDLGLELHRLARLEKTLFALLLVTGLISLLTRGLPFTNFVPTGSGWQPLFLILANLLIGVKVCSGLVVVFAGFIEEDNYVS